MAFCRAVAQDFGPCHQEDCPTEAMSLSGLVEEHIHLNLSICTANVNSLHRAPDGHAGKVQYLREQFKRLNRVVHKTPRILLVRGDSTYWTGWLLVHFGLPLGTREQFWQDLTEVADQCGNTEQPYVFLDDNASPAGAPDGRHVFCDGLSSSSSTRLLRGFLEAHDLCLPSTSDIHEGSRTTRVSADGNNEHCIDFIAIPATLQERCTLAQAVPELDLGHGDWDHTTTCLEMTWMKRISLENLSREQDHPSTPHQVSRSSRSFATITQLHGRLM